ncbi:hypothetical protein JCGZ_06147 [Jatropha curcas]|uniref:Uncharacterized protein n=1 Tax=Jatropha curcas TaxID=180498 RepID=A0A067KLG8_JATCU|nr:hypothetical protein JCGZ_06147 [Jatropha curcas]
MSSILSLSSQGLVLATAMVVSSTVLFLAFTKQKTDLQPQTSKNLDSQSPTQSLRSCLLSSENVKDTKRNGEDYRRKKGKENSTTKFDRICRNEIPGIEMPANRIALYNGILRDRVHRIECSY